MFDLLFVDRLDHRLSAGLGKVYPSVLAWDAHAVYGMVGVRDRSVFDR